MKPSTRILTLAIVSLLVASSTAQSPVERVESQSGKAWVTPEVKALRVSFHTFDSDAAKGKVSYHIYKPAAYDREGQRRLPVVYGAARLGFKYHDLFRAVSIMGGGPLQAELIQAPRAGRQRAAEVLKQVYGGDQEYFKSVSPRRLAEQNAEAMIKGSLVRQVCGDQDETFGPNRDFHEHLERLKIPHTWTVLPGVDHNPMKTLEALGDSNWKFYRAAFGQPPGTVDKPIDKT